ncbi:MAG: folylpolyglutamate synthase/dihydrofolate synthase family protein [Peptostreptococcus sp.]|uniref:bifunctional folylpolyglutamate synthase/dihydrofolate synthase n=1 Tax=Peptostreptococcus sp. TaxID=1262 RepID=UPI002FC7CCB9
MNYTEAINYIHGVDRFGMILGLDSIRELLRRLDNPQDNLNIIHIAGTNGKGSTASFISSVLVESGYKTGLYTSPFLERFNERIRIDGEEIKDEDLAECVSEVREKVDEMLEDGCNHPTEFEIVTATAFYFYNREKVDALVLEVGLGGRFDATNVIEKSLLSVIASISKDHIGVLGDTVEKIAFEKAGIIKENGQVILYGQEKNIEEVIKNIANERNANVIVTDNNKIEIKKSNLNNQVFSFTDYLGNNFEDIKIRMIGEHQIRNAVLAVNTISYLREHSIFSNITDESLRKGLLDTRWAGRLELISEKPVFVIDGAHNVEAAQLLADEIDRLFDEEWDKTLILGVLADKEVDAIVKILVPKFDRVVITLPDNPRAMKVDELAYRVGMYCDDIVCIENVDSAVQHSLDKIVSLSNEEKTNTKLKAKKKGSKKGSKEAKNIKAKKKAIFAAGSLYLVGHIRTFIKNNDDLK